MSLFENDQYIWRETYFVLFNNNNRPLADDVEAALMELGSRYELNNISADQQGRLDSLNLLSPYDFAAMDICYLSGEDVDEQMPELKMQLKQQQLTDEEQSKVDLLSSCDARFDVFHFEQVVSDRDDEEDGFLDPGALLIVLERLAELCDGVGIDPQSGEIM